MDNAFGFGSGDPDQVTRIDCMLVLSPFRYLEDHQQNSVIAVDLAGITTIILQVIRSLCYLHNTWF